MRNRLKGRHRHAKIVKQMPRQLIQKLPRQTKTKQHPSIRVHILRHPKSIKSHNLAPHKRRKAANNITHTLRVTGKQSVKISNLRIRTKANSPTDRLPRFTSPRQLTNISRPNSAPRLNSDNVTNIKIAPRQIRIRGI